MNDVFAFVSQRPCGCVNFVATAEWMFRHYSTSEVNYFVAYGKCRAMDRIGQQVPILVTEGRQIVEGHRRWAAAKYLEWDYLSACIVPNEMSEAIYAEVNSNVKKIGGADALAVWIKNPSAVMPGQNKAFAKAEGVVGKATLAYIAKMGLSCRVIRTAQSVARLCGLDNVKEIVEWLIRYSDTGMIGHIMKATEAGEVREEIRKAYLADKPVRIKLA